MVKNRLEIKKDDIRMKTLVFVSGVVVEERRHDFELDSIKVCLSCGNEFDSNDHACSCGEENEILTYKEYMGTSKF